MAVPLQCRNRHRAGFFRETHPMQFLLLVYIDPVLLEQAEIATTVELTEQFMLRVVHVEAALRARGYPKVDVDIELDIGDSELPDNNGRYRLVVREGSAEVSRGGAGKVRLDARALATLYSGYLRASDLARAARITGDARSIEALETLFLGPPPALGDFF